LLRQSTARAIASAVPRAALPFDSDVWCRNVERYRNGTGPNFSFNYQEHFMAASLFAAPMDFVGLQTSYWTKLYKSGMDVSMQIGNLNVTAGRKLMEESSAAATRAMSLKTPWEMQAFLLEQSQLAVERVRGYRQNVQDIAAGIRSDALASAGVQSSPQSSPQPSQPGAQAARAQDDDQTANEHAASHPHQHEVDPHPSALVEKMISNVVSDTEVTRH
jgi:hypothetical protein